MNVLDVLLGFNWMTIATVATAIFAAVAAVGAVCAARATRTAAEAQILLDLLKDYATQDMSDALRTLRGWYAKDRKGFAARWKADLTDRIPVAIAVDHARRRVTSYFLNVDRLHRAKLISRDTWRAAVDKDGLAVLLVVGQELERRLNPKVDLSFVERLRKLCPERTELFEEIPTGEMETLK